MENVSVRIDDFSDFFFFQAEDGIRDRDVTGVQTCALPISARKGTSRSEIARRAVRTPPPKPRE